jgi:hypothetical protein
MKAQCVSDLTFLTAVNVTITNVSDEPAASIFKVVLWEKYGVAGIGNCFAVLFVFQRTARIIILLCSGQILVTETSVQL